MTQDQYVIRRKLNILELGETLGNISEACRRLNISRQHHYDIKSAVEEEGLDGAISPLPTISFYFMAAGGRMHMDFHSDVFL